MKLKSIQLKNFKRFTDLTLQDIPENAKLVLLIGSNGSGKSCVFDAFELINKMQRDEIEEFDNNSFWEYYKKNKRKDFRIAFKDDIVPDEQFISQGNGTSLSYIIDGFYGRTSLRQIPKLTRRNLGSDFNVATDADRPGSFIERDERFENDLEHIFGKLLREFFRKDDDKSEIKNKVLLPVNNALDRIFSKENGTRLELIELIPPLEGNIAQVNFRKGKSIFHYNQLSAGEKEVFNILVNLVARREYYADTIFFFDEIDLHLNTKLQYNFLKEIIENWIPDNCQFWTASHSLGFIQYAKESKHAVIFDFDDYDFDEPRILTPESKDNPDVYQIAVGKEMLPALFQNFHIFFAENKDAGFYNWLALKNTIFVPENGRNGVYHKVKSGNYSGIVDRDFLTDEDIALIETAYKNLHVLRYYSIENYFYHPDNLEEYYQAHGKPFDKEGYIAHLVAEKNKVKSDIIPGLSLKRTELPYFGEPEYNGKEQQNRFKNKQENVEASRNLSEYLESDEFARFYKVFPMKTFATHLPERQNIPKTELAKTNWFKQQIESIIN